MGKKKLTPKQKLFVREYIVDKNATQAAIRAGYSPKAAYAIGAENLRKPQIKEAIQKQMDKYAERAEVSAERVIEEYRRIAFSDIRDIMSGENRTVLLRKLSELSPEEAAVIQSISETKEGIRVTLHSKLSALDSLAKHLGLFTKKIDLSGKIEHTGEVSMPAKPDMSALTSDDIDALRGLLQNGAVKVAGNTNNGSP